MHLTIEDRARNLERVLAEGRWHRGEWGAQQDGRALLCALSSISPEAHEARSAAACPGDVVPPWLAHLVPYINDSTTPECARRLVGRLPGLMRSWHVLDEEAWTRLDYTARAIAVRYAAEQTDDAAARAVCARVVELCERRAVGGVVDDEEWRKVNLEALAAAAWVPAEAAWAAVRAAAEAVRARAAAWAAAETAARAAAAAVWTAETTWAARETTWAAGAAATWTAAEAVRDHICTAIVDAIEAAIAEREAQGGE
jgi:hypothetical protein